MKLPQIRMEAQWGQIGIETTRGYQEIRQPKADLSVEQPSADMSIRSPKGRLTIDQTKAFEEANLMSTRRNIEIHSKRSLQKVAEGAARRAQQGDQLMKIENHSDPIVEQAKINGFTQKKDISLKYIPSPLSVKTNYEPGELQIDVQPNKPIIQATRRYPEHTYVRGDLNIYMKQYNYLEIDVVNLFSETV